MDESNTPQPTEGPRPPPSVPSIPAASSVYGIVRRHCRERIVVPPLQWTDRQLELLRISFDDFSPAPKIDRTDNYSGLGIDTFERRDMKYHLRRFHLFKSREEYFCNMFYGRDSPFRSDWFASSPLSIYIVVLPNWKIPLRDVLHVGLDRPSAKWLYSAAPCHGIYLRKPRAQWLDPEFPIGAYIDRGHIEELRKESLNLHTCNPRNTPVYSMKSHKLEQLRPANPFKDPYIAALLIAVAQRWRLVLEAEKPEDLSALEIYPAGLLTVIYYGEYSTNSNIVASSVFIWI